MVSKAKALKPLGVDWSAKTLINVGLEGADSPASITISEPDKLAAHRYKQPLVLYNQTSTGPSPRGTSIKSSLLASHQKFLRSPLARSTSMTSP